MQYPWNLKEPKRETAESDPLFWKPRKTKIWSSPSRLPDPRNQDAVHTPSNMKLTPFMWAYLWNSKSPYLASNLGSWLVESRWCDQCRVFGGRPNMEGIYGGENMAFISRVLCLFDGESLAYLLELWFTGVSIVSFRVLPPPNERVYCFHSRGLVG